MAASGLLPGEGISALLLAATICGRFLSCENFRARNPGVEGHTLAHVARGQGRSQALTIPEQFLRQPWQAAGPKGQQAAGGTSTVQVAPGARAIPRASRAVPARQRDHHSGGPEPGKNDGHTGFSGSLSSPACSPKPGWSLYGNSKYCLELWSLGDSNP